jgi:hypothetical protein
MRVTSGLARSRMLLAAITLSVMVALPAAASGKVEPAHGGRIPCSTVAQCRATNAHLAAAVRWQKKNRAHLALQLARTRSQTSTLDLWYVCRIGEVVYHVKASHCVRVVGCESGGNQHQVTSPTDASGLGQFLPSTWTGTAFGRAGFSVFDPLPNVLQMDAIAAGQGFNTRYGWRASHSCHGLSGPEAT